MKNDKLVAWNVSTHGVDKRVIFHYSKMQIKIFITNLEGWDNLSSIVIERAPDFDKYLSKNVPYIIEIPFDVKDWGPVDV